MNFNITLKECDYLLEGLDKLIDQGYSALLHFQKNGLQAQVDHINTCMKEITELSKKIKNLQDGML